MNGINTLTPSKAQKLIDAAADCDKCLISDVTNLYEDAATVLATYPGKIFLDDLRRISDSAAIALQSHKGGLSFKSLKVSDELSEILARYQGELCLSFELAHINHLSCSLASLILTSGSNRDCLDFEGLETVSWNVAQILSDFGGDLLLNKIETLSHSSARMLALHKGKIELKGITNLTDLEASALAMHHGEIYLDGITSINESVAASLVNHRGRVMLRGIENISIEVAEILAAWGDNILIRIDGKIPDSVFEILTSKNRIKPFSLGNFELKRITPKSAAFLIECVLSDLHGGSHLDLMNLEDICFDTALCLANFHGSVSLSGLKYLKCSVAEALSRHRGILNLNGLNQISDDAAEFLGRHQGELRINGLSIISDMGAKFISKHQGRVCLDGLGSISDKFAQEFSVHQGDLSLRGVTELSDNAAESLSNRGATLSLIGLEFLDQMKVFTPSIARLFAKLGRRNKLSAIDEEIIGILADEWDCDKNGYIYIGNVRSITKNTAIAFCDRYDSFGHLILNYADEEILNVFLRAKVYVLCIPTTPKEVETLLKLYSFIITEHEKGAKPQSSLSMYQELSIEEKAFMFYMEELRDCNFLGITLDRLGGPGPYDWVARYYKIFKEKFPESGNAFEPMVEDIINRIQMASDCEQASRQWVSDSLLDSSMELDRS